MALNSDDPTTQISCDGTVAPTDKDSQEFVSLALAYYHAQLNIQGTKLDLDSLISRNRTTQNTTKRQFSVSEAILMKEADAKIANASLAFKEAEEAYKAAHSALDNWIPDSLKPLLKVTGCIVAPNVGGSYPWIGITAPRGDYMVIQSYSEEQVYDFARSEKEASQRDNG